MSYVKKEWKIKDFQKGDKELVDSLNHMEQGIAEGGGGGEPAEYLKDAIKSADGNTLTITKKDGTQVIFTPTGGSGEPAAYLKEAIVNAEKLTITKKDGSTVELDISGKADQTALNTEIAQRESQYSQIDTRLNGKQDKLTAGTNITIDENNVISATGGSGEPAAYIKDATVANEKLTLTKKDSSIVELDISNKAKIGDSYLKSESDAKYLTEHQDISGKANVGDSYLKAESDAKYLTEHQDISGKVDKPTEPVIGQGVNVPYYFDVNYSADKVTVKDYTIDLLNKDKAPQQFSIDINCASQTNAGLMSAADKKAVDEMLPAYPADTDAEYILALKYVDGAWVKYWKEIANKSDIVDKGTVDYMVIKQ